MKRILKRGLLWWWSSCEDSTCQCRGHRFDPLVWEASTCLGETKAVYHNYWTCALESTTWAHTLEHVSCSYQSLHPTEACDLLQEKPPQSEACTPQRRVASTHCNQRKPSCSNEDPVQSKINKIRRNKEQTKGSAQQQLGTYDCPETKRKKNSFI